ncbi:MAG TPA: HEPN domain-containing protein [Terriglobia bacterium]|nr:HEPN domain-containing protein [Terriglobia bacterium]
MNGTVKEWIAKAEGDYATARRELHPQGIPNFDAVCFHSEQCAEKLMKALLIHLGVTPPRSHDLVALDRLLAPACPGWSWAANDLRLLTRAAVDFRYPGEAADEKEASEAFEISTRIRAKLLTLLGVSP